MATDEEILKAFKLVLGAGLEYPPTRDEIPGRAEAWLEFLSDIPGDCLMTASRDIVLKSERFPSVPRMREAAKQVQIHNGASAVSSPFEPMPPAGKREVEMFRLTRDGWKVMDTAALSKLLPEEKQQEYRDEYVRMLADETTPPPAGYTTWLEWAEAEMGVVCTNIPF